MTKGTRIENFGALPKYSRELEKYWESVNFGELGTSLVILDWLDNFLMEGSQRNRENQILRNLLDETRIILCVKQSGFSESATEKKLEIPPSDTMFDAIVQILDRSVMKKIVTDLEKKYDPLPYLLLDTEFEDLGKDPSKISSKDDNIFKNNNNRDLDNQVVKNNERLQEEVERETAIFQSLSSEMHSVCYLAKHMRFVKRFLWNVMVKL